MPGFLFFFSFWLRFFFFLDVVHFGKSLLNLLQYCFCFRRFFFWSQGMWDLISLTRYQTCIPCIGKWSLNHWITRKVSRLPAEWGRFWVHHMAATDTHQEQTETQPLVGSSNWGWLCWAYQHSVGYKIWTEMGLRIPICFSFFLASLFFFLLLINSFIVLKKIGHAPFKE